MSQLFAGDRVQWTETKSGRTLTGVLIEQRRGTNVPWKVWAVRAPNGTEHEVHSDRLQPAKKPRPSVF